MKRARQSGERLRVTFRGTELKTRQLSRIRELVGESIRYLAETFVDVSRFRGTCYRAANWRCVDETQGWSKSGDGHRFHGQPKSVWLYPLARDFKTQLCDAPRAATGSCAHTSLHLHPSAVRVRRAPRYRDFCHRREALLSDATPSPGSAAGTLSVTLGGRGLTLAPTVKVRQTPSI